MRTRFLITQIATLLLSASCALALEPIELSWKQNGEWDSLLINGVEIPFTGQSTIATIETMSERLKSTRVDFASHSVKVTIPEIPDHQPPLLPTKFPGLFGQIFDSLTGLDREVIYVHHNRRLHRYLIRCSSKGTAENPEAANYWLDGEFLGTWEQAKPRFESTKWEEDAVADILFDRSDMLTSSGVGLYLMPELQDIFSKHHIAANAHQHCRKATDR